MTKIKFTRNEWGDYEDTEGMGICLSESMSDPSDPRIKYYYSNDDVRPFGFENLIERFKDNTTVQSSTIDYVLVTVNYEPSELKRSFELKAELAPIDPSIGALANSIATGICLIPGGWTFPVFKKNKVFFTDRNFKAELHVRKLSQYFSELGILRNYNISVDVSLMALEGNKGRLPSREEVYKEYWEIVDKINSDTYGSFQPPAIVPYPRFQLDYAYNDRVQFVIKSTNFLEALSNQRNKVDKSKKKDFLAEMLLTADKLNINKNSLVFLCAVGCLFETSSQKLKVFQKVLKLDFNDSSRPFTSDIAYNGVSDLYVIKFLLGSTLLTGYERMFITKDKNLALLWCLCMEFDSELLKSQYALEGLQYSATLKKNMLEYYLPTYCKIGVEDIDYLKKFLE